MCSSGMKNLNRFQVLPDFGIPNVESHTVCALHLTSKSSASFYNIMDIIRNEANLMSEYI
jgi:hypothetical protein